MKIFIDTAKIDEIEQAYSLGVLDGVTTNPSLIKKAVDELKAKGEKVDMDSYIRNILKVARGTPVSLEVIGTTHEEMVREGKRLFEKFNPVAKNVYIKIPVNPCCDDSGKNVFDGIKAVKELTDSGIPINCTLIFTPEQAWLAAKAGAKFVSPFAGRVDDYIKAKHSVIAPGNEYYPAEGLRKGSEILDDCGIVSGIDLVRQCVQLFRMHNIKTEVLAASIRNTRQVRESALAGADIATIPLNVIRDLLYHCKTSEGMRSFIKDIVPEYESVVRRT